MSDDDCSNCEKDDCKYRNESYYCRVEELKNYLQIEDFDIRILQSMYNKYERLYENAECFDIDILNPIKDILKKYEEAKEMIR